MPNGCQRRLRWTELSSICEAFVGPLRIGSVAISSTIFSVLHSLHHPEYCLYPPHEISEMEQINRMDE